MFVCPICRGRYSSGTSRCPADGCVLVSEEVFASAMRSAPEPATVEIEAPAGLAEVAVVATMARDTIPDVGGEREPAIGSVVGDFRLEGKLGQGGMGTVYHARHPLIGKRVAIKVIHPFLCANRLAVDRFVNEAKAINLIGHPNIVDVFTFGTLPDGRCYLIMELLVGESLTDRLKRERLPFHEALDVVEAITGPLLAAHAEGIVHRDLKPDNVFLVTVKGGPPQVKLLDFGIAKLSLGDERERTATGAVMGTPLYISPEQALGRPVDARADIYALGVVAYELILGRPPFEADSAVEVMSLHASAIPEAPSRLWPAIPTALEALLLQMLAKEPTHRPTLETVRDRIAELRAGGSTARTPRRRPMRSGLWAGLVAGALLAATAVTLLALRERRRPAPIPSVTTTSVDVPAAAPPPATAPAPVASPAPGEQGASPEATAPAAAKQPPPRRPPAKDKPPPKPDTPDPVSKGSIDDVANPFPE